MKHLQYFLVAQKNDEGSFSKVRSNDTIVCLCFKTKTHKHSVSRPPVQKDQHVFHSSAKETKPSTFKINKSKTTAKEPIAHQACLATWERSTENSSVILRRALSPEWLLLTVQQGQGTGRESPLVSWPAPQRCLMLEKMGINWKKGLETFHPSGCIIKLHFQTGKQCLLFQTHLTAVLDSWIFMSWRYQSHRLNATKTPRRVFLCSFTLLSFSNSFLAPRSAAHYHYHNLLVWLHRFSPWGADTQLHPRGSQYHLWLRPLLQHSGCLAESGDAQESHKGWPITGTKWVPQQWGQS